MRPARPNRYSVRRPWRATRRSTTKENQMADTKALEDLNKEVVKLVDELSGMQAKQERLRDLLRQRAELEQQILGVSSDAAARPGPRRRANGTERVEAAAPPAAG